ncbi:MAG: PilW family protein [Pseudomonadota bacterium]
MNAARAMRGMVLAELSVALLLGALVTLVASALLVDASGNYRYHAESARVNDNGRYALALIGQAVRQASFIDWDGADAPAAATPDAGASVAGLDARSVQRGSDGIEQPLASSVNGSDVLALRYAGSGASGGDGSMLNCAGFAVGAPASEQERGWSIFYVAEDGDGEAELRCKYKSEHGWGADAIVRGVDSFQVLYGLDTDTPPDGVPNRYLNASAINALDDALVLEETDAAAQERERKRRTHWKRVASIRIALLLHGEAHSRAGSAPASYDLFGRDYADATPGDAGVRIDEHDLPPLLKARARRVFSLFIALRNPNGGA